MDPRSGRQPRDDRKQVVVDEIWNWYSGPTHTQRVFRKMYLLLIILRLLIHLLPCEILVMQPIAVRSRRADAFGMTPRVAPQWVIPWLGWINVGLQSLDDPISNSDEFNASTLPRY